MQYNEKKRSIMKIFFQFREYFMLDFLQNELFSTTDSFTST